MLILIVAGCGTPYHGAMREMARPETERAHELVRHVHASHVALEDGLELMFEQKAKAVDTQAPRTTENLRMLDVALDRVELRKWERTHRILAVADLADSTWRVRSSDHEDNDQHGDSALACSVVSATYARLIDAMEQNDAKAAALLTSVREYVAAQNSSQGGDEPRSLPPASQELADQWALLNAHNEHVREMIDEMLQRLRDTEHGETDVR